MVRRRDHSRQAWLEGSKNFRVSVSVRSNIAARLRASRQYQGLDLTGRRGSFTRSSLLVCYRPDSRARSNSTMIARKLAALVIYPRHVVACALFTRTATKCAPEAPYQLPLAYISKWGRSLTSPVSEAGPPHSPASPPTTGTSEKSPNSPLPYRPDSLGRAILDTGTVRLTRSRLFSTGDRPS